MSEVKTETRAAHRGARGWRWLAAGVVVAVSATVGLSAWAHGRGGMGGHGGFMGGRLIERMLDDVKATEAQRAQIRQITQQAASDMQAQRDSRRTLHDRAMQVFTAPNVDASAAESIRQEMLTQHDATSRRMLQAMLDVSRVLTPEQRAQLAERMKERRGRMEERMKRHMDGQADRPQPPTQ